MTELLWSSVPDTLAITAYPLDIADAPTEIRWRAWWNGDRSAVYGIELRCYPVLKVTAQGAWIDQYAYYHSQWVTSGERRWVSDAGGQAWAKPTRQAALDSLAVRYDRWAGRLMSDINYFRAAGHVLAELMPERAAAVKYLREAVAATGAEVAK